MRLERVGEETILAGIEQRNRLTDDQRAAITRRDNGAALAVVPGLIGIIDQDTGEPITTELLRYGLRVTVLGIPATAMLKTPAAFTVVSPAAFGYPDVEYKPLPGSMESVGDVSCAQLGMRRSSLSTQPTKATGRGWTSARMTKVGVIADAHANRPALEAVLAALKHEGCELIFHLGDAIGIGPHPVEALGILLNAKNMRFVRGNHDDYFVVGLSRAMTSRMTVEELEHQRWTHRQLSSEMREAMATWPYSTNLAVAGIQASFCHYAQDGEGSGFAEIIPHPDARALDELFGAGPADVVFYGHHHLRSDLRGKARYVNPGALGCGSDGLARYAILDVETDGNWDVRFGDVPYDVSVVLNDLEVRKVPACALIKRAFYGQNE